MTEIRIVAATSGSFAISSLQVISRGLRCGAPGHLVVSAAVNANNPLHSVTIEQLRKAFAGGAVLWRDIREAGVAARIDLFCPSPFAAESDLFQKIVMLDTPLADVLLDRTVSLATRKTTPKRSSEPSLKILTPSATFALATRGRQTNVFVSWALRGRKLQAGSADAGHRQRRHVPAHRQAHALRTARRETRSSGGIRNFALGPAAAKIARNCGYWPAYDMKPLDEKTRLAEVKAHHAAEIAVSGRSRPGRH